MNQNKEFVEKKEDFFVQASLGVAGKDVKDIPCKIYLPETPMGKPLFKFKPTTEQYEIISRFHDCSFSAYISGFNGKKEVSLFAPVVYFSKMSKRYWGPSFTEATFNGNPQDLQVIHHVDSSKEKASSTTHIVFWISPNSRLEPRLFPKYCPHGTITYSRTEQKSIRLTDKLTITFDKHFKVSSKRGDNLIQTSFLVGCAETDLSVTQVNTIITEAIPQLDKFLLIASLGSRTRTTCVGFETSFYNNIAQYFRGDLSFPSGKSEFLLNCAHSEDFAGSRKCDGLIKPWDFQEYLETSYASLLEYPNQDALCDAIITLIPGKKRAMEESFLAIFAGLETVILDYRKRFDLEFVEKDNKAWGKLKGDFCKALRKTLKNEKYKNMYSSTQRKYIYHKLDELNRIPLRIVFDSLCSKYEIDVSDLWPLFNTDGIVGLADIRNKLIHGDPISRQYIKMLCEAERSLQFMLERILLKILNFPICKSQVAKSLLNGDSYELCWTDEEQREFSNYIQAM